jgi:DNA end-binding protein Ku
MPAATQKRGGRTAKQESGPREKPPRAAERTPGTSRSIWKGAISFGMVTIPVRLYPATASKDIAFNLLHSKCSSRLKQLRWCPVCNREVPWDEVMRGYPYSKDRYVTFTEEDFEKAPVASKHTIELSAFVRDEEIDPVYFEKSYYLEPDEGARKSFALLARTLETKNQTAIGKIALRERERLCALRPSEDGLLLETLFYPDEIRAAPAVALESVDVSPREMEMASSLVDLLSERFQPEKYRDEYRTALLEMVEAKLHGEQIVEPPAPPEGKILDLAAALKASFEAAKRQKAAETPKRRKTAA